MNITHYQIYKDYYKKYRESRKEHYRNYCRKWNREHREYFKQYHLTHEKKSKGQTKIEKKDIILEF